MDTPRGGYILKKRFVQMVQKKACSYHTCETNMFTRGNSSQGGYNEKINKIKWQYYWQNTIGNTGNTIGKILLAIRNIGSSCE